MSSTDIDPVALANDALRILSVRMESEPEEIPSGGLLRLAEQLAKLEMARIQAQPPEELKRDPTVSEILAMDGLPPERKLVLLRDESEKLASEQVRILAAIEEMEELPTA